MSIKTSNRDSARYVTQCLNFKANNLHGEWSGNVYAVYSYGWYPVFVYSAGQWFENENRYSPSTAKQMTQCGWKIRGEAIPVSTDHLKQIIAGKVNNDTAMEMMDNLANLMFNK